MIRKVARTVLPAGSKRRIAAGRVKQLILHGPKNQFTLYNSWIKNMEPTTLSPVIKNQSVLISIIVPCHNTLNSYGDALVKSLINQTYGNWQLCLADGSTDEQKSENIKSYTEKDSRINYVRVVGEQGISQNTNAAIEITKGQFIGFLDHDDVLPEWALNEVAVAISSNPKGNIFYSDEDRLTRNGKRRTSPFFKPDWSPELFFSANYVTHFFVIKADLLKKLKGLRPQFNGSQDYDLMLRALEHEPTIVHIPKVLYHMRMAKTSTASNIAVKDYAQDTGSEALADYFKRNKINAKVLQIPDRPTNYRIKYELDTGTKISIIIPFKDKVDLLKTCVGSILKKTAYKNYEIILVSNNSTEKATYNYLDSLKDNQKIKIYKYDEPFNFSAVNNFGRKYAKGKVLVFLNNDTEVLNKEWLEELASISLRDGVGEVGALLFYPKGTIQHAGVVLGMLGTAGHVFRDLKPGTLTPFWLPDWPRNYLAVTAACVAIESKKFDQMRGFDEEFKTAGQDVRLGIALHEAGYRNVYWPFAQLIHYENVSVGKYNKREDNRHDYEVSMRYYKPYIETGDPYYNPNLDIMSEIPELRRKNERI
jgi:GT2 family glycosyltransferase